MRRNLAAATLMHLPVLLAVLACPAARAQSTLVIESLVGQENSDVDRYLPEVVKGLGAPPARSGTSLGADIDAHFGPAPGRLSSSSIAELQARLKQSERNVFLMSTHVRESIEDMEDIRTRLADALWTLSHKPEARALYQAVLLKLARAYQVNTRIPDSAKLAQARMEEVVRYFQDMPPDLNKIEKELTDFFITVQKQLPASSALKVQLGGPSDRICVNGCCFSSSPIKLPAGDYRYFVSGAHGESRVHKVTLAAGERRNEFADVDFETALRTDAFVGLAYDSAATRDANERGYAAALGRNLKADEVVVLKDSSVGGKPFVVVAAYRTSDRAVVAVGAPGAAGVVPADQLGRAAQRLRLEERAIAGKAQRPTTAQDQAAGLVVLESANRPSAQPPAPTELIATAPVGRHTDQATAPKRQRSPSAARDDGADDPTMRNLAKWGWVSLGLAVPTSIVGSALYARQYVGTCESTTHLCAHQYSRTVTEDVGFPLVVVGMSFAAVSAFVNVRMYLRPARDLGVELIVVGATALISGGLYYQPSNVPIAFTRQPNGSVTASTPQTSLHQGTVGLALMGAGAGVAVVGASLVLVDQYVLRPKRDRERAVVVAPAFAPSFAGLSLSGRF
jgi:hypothetical protein